MGDGMLTIGSRFFRIDGALRKLPPVRVAKVTVAAAAEEVRGLFARDV